MTAVETSRMNRAQMMIVESFADVSDDSETNALMDLLRDFYAARLKRELSRLSDDGTLGEAALESLRERHLRTPYRRATT